MRCLEEHREKWISVFCSLGKRVDSEDREDSPDDEEDMVYGVSPSYNILQDNLKSLMLLIRPKSLDSIGFSNDGFIGLWLRNWFLQFLS